MPSVQPLLSTLAAAGQPGALVHDDGDIEFARVLLAGETAPLWLDTEDDNALSGWDDLPSIDSGNVTRPSRHGSWPGTPLGQERIVTASCVINAVTDADRMWATQAIRAITAIAPDATEQPLVIRTVGEALLAWGHVTARQIPQGKAYVFGAGRATIQWTCSDPRKYGLTEKTVSLAPASSTGGLTWPLTWPLVWNTTVTGGGRTATNAGDTPTHPTIRINGPIGAPKLTNGATGFVLESAIALAEGEYLEIDCAAGTVLLNGSADRLYTLTSRSDPVEAFTLIPGANPLTMTAAGIGSTIVPATVRWRDATM